jgi:hypothetical protein
MPSKPDRSVRLSKSAIDALWQGNVVGAISLVRKERGIGMAEAKELVVTYIGTQPALKKKTRSRCLQRPNGDSSVGWQGCWSWRAAIAYFLMQT